LPAACAGGGNTPDYIQSQEPKRIHSNASVGDLVQCLKSKLQEEATIVPYAEPGKVDIRIGHASASEMRYFYLIYLRAAAQGSDVEIRSAGEWHPILRQGRIEGIVEDCKPGAAARIIPGHRPTHHVVPIRPGVT
jgi:hypothetical protein